MPAPPFWPAPVPRVLPGRNASPLDLQELFGWDDRYRWYVRGAVIVVSALTVLESVILILSLEINLGGLPGDTKSDVSLPLNLVLGLLTCLTGAAFYFVLYRFWVRDIVPEPRNHTVSLGLLTRRDILVTCAGFAVPPSRWIARWLAGELGAILTGNRQPRRILSAGCAPRFRKRPGILRVIERRVGDSLDCVLDNRQQLRFVSALTPEVQPNLRAWKQGRIHADLGIPMPPNWVKLIDFLRAHPDDSKLFRYSNRLRGKRRTDQPSISGPVLHRAHLSWSIEGAAEEALRRDDVDAAIYLLKRGIALQPFSARLYDRLATIAAQHDREGDLSDLIKHTEDLLSKHVFRPRDLLAIGTRSRRVSRLLTAAGENQAKQGGPAPQGTTVLARGAEHLRVRLRKRCKNGVLMPRPPGAQHGIRTIDAESMQQRVDKWKKNDSKWRRQQSSKLWKLPGVPRLCPRNASRSCDISGRIITDANSRP